MKTRKTNKKGISLIVLVITIIVMIILASTIILSLSNDNIFNKAEEAVNKTNLKTIQELASTLWAEAYLDGARTKAEFEEAITEGLINQGINPEDYPLIITANGVTVESTETAPKTEPVPEKWKENVVAMVDKVPIPKGFVASPYGEDAATGRKAENTKAGGLVIYELDSTETEIPSDETYYESLTERNQYVWVPVDDFENQFRRQNFGKTRVSIVETDIGVYGDYWEVILDSTNMPDVAKNTAKSSFMTVTTPENGITNTLSEVQAMYASVKEYGGFYIARYEAGLEIADRKTSDDGEIKTAVYSKMNKAPYNYVRWTKNNSMSQDTEGAVAVARSMYPVNSTSNTTGVVSTLTYGVQWDRTLAWYIETKAMTLEEVRDDSTAYGNYRNRNIASNTELNTGAQYSSDEGQNYNPVTANYSKGSDTTDEEHLLTTGALKAAKVNNIYDMAGNVVEWTMEGNSDYFRVKRGGQINNGVIGSVSHRSFDRVPGNANHYMGFRPTLYIKK